MYCSKSSIFILILALHYGHSQEFEDSKDICQRCSCKSDDLTFTMDCTNQNIHDSLANWPDEHINKTLKVTFSHNNITTIKSMPTTDSMVWIVLSYCEVKYLDPGIFENMKNVDFVDLSHNLLTNEELSTEKFKGPYKDNENEPIMLTSLNLAYNQIHSLENKVFDHTPHLRYLNLEGNHFRVLDIHTQMALSSLKELTRVNLANNQLVDLPSSMLTNFQSLTHIDLSKNDFNYVPTSLKSVGNTLESLTMDENPILEMDDKTFLGLHQLSELSLSNLSKLHTIHDNTFLQLKTLRKLKITGSNSLRFFGPDLFDKNQELDELYLTGNNLEDLSDNLLKWESLKIFDIHDNPLRCSCQLYNISRRLATTITESNYGPYCFSEDKLSYQVFEITEEICAKDITFHVVEQLNHSGKITIIIVTVVGIWIILLGFVIGFLRYRKYGNVFGRINRTFTDATPSGVIYTPVLSERE